MKNKRKQHAHTVTLDASGKVLGRLASRVAVMLRGKDTVSFQPHVLGNRHIFVYNLSQIKVTGKKREQKTYWRYSGYPGGIRAVRYKDLSMRDPTIVFRKAVWGMLPKNRLRAKMLRHLRLYSEGLKE